MEKQFYVYVLASKRHGTLYIGVTSALVQRVWQHKTKAVEGFTAKYGVDQLVYFEAHGDAASAIQREAAEEVASSVEDPVDRGAQSRVARFVH